MKRGSKQLLQEQGGSSIVLVGLALVVLLAAMALVVDGGTVFVERSHLQKTANAAVLSGAQELTHQQAAVTGVIQTILQRHEEAASLQSSAINMGQNVSVQLAKTVSLGFSKLLGKDTVTVAANAAAQITPIGAAKGAAPVGIDQSIVLQFGQQYRLKVDEEDSVNGFFGILALGGKGSTVYEKNLKYGYSNEIKVGDIIETDGGNKVGKTRTGVQYLIDLSPYTPGDTSHPDDPRIILVPVYKPCSGVKRVEVTGFAYFYITDPTDDHDKTINGIFIKQIGTGTAKPGASDRGAYTIRLIE